MFRDFFIEAGLYIVAARPGMGKSALAANIMKEQLSADEKQGAMYVHTKEMCERLEGFLEQEERIKIVDGTALSTEIIFLEARWMKADYGLKMVVIDDIYNLLKNQSYMHIEPSKKERVTYLFTRFKSMAAAVS